MSIKRLSELTYEEACKLLKSSERFHDIVENYYIYNQSHHLEEVLCKIKDCIEYCCIDFHSKCHFNIGKQFDDNFKFMEGLKRIQKMYSFLDPKYDEDIEKCVDVIECLDDCTFEDSKRRKIVKTIIDKAKEYEKIFLEQLNEETEIDEECLESVIMDAIDAPEHYCVLETSKVYKYGELNHLVKYPDKVLERLFQLTGNYFDKEEIIYWFKDKDNVIISKIGNEHQGHHGYCDIYSVYEDYEDSDEYTIYVNKDKRIVFVK